MKANHASTARSADSGRMNSRMAWIEASTATVAATTRGTLNIGSEADFKTHPPSVHLPHNCFRLMPVSGQCAGFMYSFSFLLLPIVSARILCACLPDADRDTDGGFHADQADPGFRGQNA